MLLASPHTTHFIHREKCAANAFSLLHTLFSPCCWSSQLRQMPEGCLLQPGPQSSGTDCKVTTCGHPLTGHVILYHLPSDLVRCAAVMQQAMAETMHYHACFDLPRILAGLYDQSGEMTSSGGPAARAEASDDPAQQRGAWHAASCPAEEPPAEASPWTQERTRLLWQIQVLCSALKAWHDVPVCTDTRPFGELSRPTCLQLEIALPRSLSVLDV